MAICFVICACANKNNRVHDDDILFYHGALQNLLVICISIQLDKNITNSLHYISYSTDTAPCRGSSGWSQSPTPTIRVHFQASPFGICGGHWHWYTISPGTSVLLR
jgi:hypothetical protein